MSGYLAETLIATTLLMAVVLLLRPWVRRRLGAGAAYALWLAPAVRLVPLSELLPDAPAVLPAGPIALIGELAPAPPEATPWLMIVWATGALLFAGGHVLAYRRFLRRANAGASITRDDVDLVTTDAVDGPAAAGLLVRRIFLPIDFAERFDADERALALRHERAHHARGDLWANAAALGMLSLHWFNPLAHRAHRAFREDQELACDAAVIGASGPETRAAYAAAMVKSAWGAAPPFTCPMSRVGSIKRRLEMVGTHKKSALASFGGALSVGALALGGLTLTATRAAAADPVVRTERIVIKTGDRTEAEAQLGKILGSKCGAVARDEIETLSGAQGPARVILCNKTGAPTNSVAALQRARDTIASSSNLTDADRTRVLGSLDEALAKARSR